MTRKTSKRKQPCPGKRKAAPPRPRARSAPRKARGPSAVVKRPLGTVDVLTVKRGEKSYMHVFKGASPTLHQVEGQEGVLVLVGDFKVDSQGMIHG